MNTYNPGFKELMALPVNNPERPKLSERVRLTGDALARRAYKYLTFAEVYNERKRVPRTFHLPNPVTQRLKCKPFESGKGVLPGMESHYRDLRTMQGLR